MTRADEQGVEFIDWPRFERLMDDLARAIVAAGYRPDLVVAIGRGGYVPARVLCDRLGTRDLVGFQVTHYRETAVEAETRLRYPLPPGLHARRVLLVDDVMDSGSSLALGIGHLCRTLPDCELRTAVIHYKSCAEGEPDFCAARVERWRWILYPWALVEDGWHFVQTAGLADQPASRVQTRLAADFGLALSLAQVEAILHFGGGGTGQEEAP